MAKTQAVSQTQNSGMMVVISFFTLLLVNSVVLYIAQMFFPKSIVLGTHALSFWWAVGMSMGKLALIGTLAIPFVHAYEIKRRKMLSSMEWMVVYFVLNFVGLWLITRFSEQFGLGVTSWMVIAGLALVLDVVQGAAMMTVGKMQEK